jgi:hypothetical protein
MSKSQVLSEEAQASYESAVTTGSLESFDLKPFEPMLTKFACETWTRIPASHRRHICYEDVYQEAQLRAWTAIKSYDRRSTTKLSSWVYGTLKLRMREVHAPFTDPKRCSGRVGIVVDLDDAPEASDPVSVEDVIHAFDAFGSAYTNSDDTTQQIYLDALGFRSPIYLNPPDERKVALDYAIKFDLTRNDFRVLRSAEPERCLLMAAHHARSSQPGPRLPQVECVRCGSLYPVSEAGTTIDVKTLVCSNCYATAAASSTTCFAKESHYDLISPECSRWCPDRKVCGVIQIEGSFMGVQLTRDKTKQLDTERNIGGDPVGDITLSTEALEPYGVEVEFASDDDVSAEGFGTEDDSVEFPGPEDESVEVLDVEDGSLELPVADADHSAEVSHADHDETPGELSDDDRDDPFFADDAGSEGSTITPQPAKAAAQPSKKGAIKKPVVKNVAPTLPKPAKVVQAVKTPATPKGKMTPLTAASKTTANTSKSAQPAIKPKRELKEFKPQYWTGQAPFRPGTAMALIFDKLTEKVDDPTTGKQVIKGIKLERLQSYVEKQSLNWRGVRHNLAKGRSYNGQWTWSFTIVDNIARIRVTERPGAEYRKACGDPVKPIVTAKVHVKKAAPKK